MFRLSVCMPDSEFSLTTLLMVLLPIILLLLFVVFLVVLRISSRLRSIERFMQESRAAKEEEVAEKREIQQRKQTQFDEFLNEDGKRRMLSKREQAEAFRQWRRDHGKTWGADEGAGS